MPRIVVISNRVSLPDAGGHTAPGGLAVAVEAALRDHDGLWFGWSGQVTDAPGALVDRQHGHIRYLLTDLRPHDFQAYYNGFANRVLWPIMHYRIDLAEYSRADFEGYRRVNEFFAERLSPLLRPDDLIWVHDYHLMLFAHALRARGHANRIGFFLHIPLPPPDLLIALPRHEQVVGALTEFNLIGFQTDNDVANYARYLTTVAGAQTGDGRRWRRGHQHFRIGAFPVGLDADGFRRMAEEGVRSDFARALQNSLEGRALMVGIDRLDYSKGILNRIDAYERFLERHPEQRGHVTYLQIAPASRRDIPEYMDIDAAVNAKVGHINGRFGEVSWVPLRYVNHPYDRAQVATVLRLARIALVTPIRDGMNLVAKEFVAAQDTDDPGVLVLSRFAGAAAELKAALMVNPHDRDAVADAIQAALDMPPDERRARHRDMVAILEANPIRHWGRDFLAELSGDSAPGRASKRVPVY